MPSSVATATVPRHLATDGEITQTTYATGRAPSPELGPVRQIRPGSGGFGGIFTPPEKKVGLKRHYVCTFICTRWEAVFVGFLRISNGFNDGDVPWDSVRMNNAWVGVRWRARLRFFNFGRIKSGN